MLEQHPITPPSELYKQWEGMPRSLAFEAAYRAGADQELEACCGLMDEWGLDGDDLMECRRPKPPSLAEEAYGALDTYIYGNPDHNDKERTYNTIRRALERLQELENNG